MELIVPSCAIVVLSPFWALLLIGSFLEMQNLLVVYGMI